MEAKMAVPMVYLLLLCLLVLYALKRKGDVTATLKVSSWFGFSLEAKERTARQVKRSTSRKPMTKARTRVRPPIHPANGGDA